ncbi:MAG: ATP-binding protein [Spirochaetia bacterium]|nr:ATP-binding protein [Spirochaetia bacterium]
MQIYGDPGAFIKIKPGKPDFNLYSIMIPALRTELRVIVQKVVKRQKTLYSRPVHIMTEDVENIYRAVIRPVEKNSSINNLALISFEKAVSRTAGKIEPDTPDENLTSRISELEHELTITRESLQTVIEELETSNESLQSMNEEAQAGNEELQASNEELTTLNDELSVRTTQLAEAMDDMEIIQNSSDRTIAVVDRDLNIRSYNKKSSEFFKIDPAFKSQNLASVPELFDLDAPLIESFREVSKSGKTCSTEFMHKNREYILEVFPYQTDNVISECLRLIGEMAHKRNISLLLSDSIDCETCKKPCAIWVDQSRFRQILLNLLSNAVKYNRKEGQVKLLYSCQNNSHMRFTVFDTGLGIPKDRQKELFQPFHRLGAERSNIDGTGTGLSITKRLTDAMGREIGYWSNEGKGSEFWVEFPLAPLPKIDQKKSDGNMAKPDIDKIVRDFSNSNPVVLYIEDNPINQALMEQIFVKKLHGIRLLSAHNAEIGLEIAHQEKPDLILMDMNLPGMSGLEELIKIKFLPDLKETTVLAVSVNAVKSDIENALAAGFTRYIIKPFKVDDTVAAVTQRLIKIKVAAFVK